MSGFFIPSLLVEGVLLLSKAKKAEAITANTTRQMKMIFFMTIDLNGYAIITPSVRDSSTCLNRRSGNSFSAVANKF